MKKTYISPAFITVKLSVRNHMLTGSLTTTSAAFFDEDAGDGDILAKEVIGDINLWDNEW